MRLSLAQTSKGTENRGFEDGRAAMQDRSNFVIGYHADGRPWRPYISKVVVDMGLISNLYLNLRHLELTIENHSKLEIPEETILAHLLSLRIAGTNIRTASNITELIKCCPNLLALDLKSAFISDEKVRPIMLSCLQIEMLDLSFAGFDCEILSVLASAAANLPQLKVLIILGCVYPLTGTGVNIKFDHKSSLPGKEIILDLLQRFPCLVSLLGVNKSWMKVSDFMRTSPDFVGIGEQSHRTLLSYPAQYRSTVKHSTYKLECSGRWSVLEEGTQDWHTAWGTRYTCLPGSRLTSDLLRSTTTKRQHINRVKGFSRFSRSGNKRP